MPATIIENVEHNTVAIDNHVCHMGSFKEKVFTDAGFKLVKLSTHCDITLNITRPIIFKRKFKSGNTRVHQPTVQERIRFNHTIKNDFEEELQFLLDIYPDAKWAIKEIIAVHKKSGKVFLFEVKNHSSAIKKCIVMEINGEPWSQLEVPKMVKLLGNLADVTCYWQKGVVRMPLTCPNY